MSRGPGSRPLLPQTTPMQTFQFAPPNLGIGDTKKNYVFVDEHNRHKRLKVMRACEGCRRRKIKCDAATTNSWPCAACVRLKLQCVPPTVNYNRTHTTTATVSGLERVLDFDNSSGGSGDEDYDSTPMVHNVYQMSSGPDMVNATNTAYTGSFGASYPPTYSIKPESHTHLNYDSVAPMPLSAPEMSYQSQPSYHLPASSQLQIPDSTQWHQPHEDPPSAAGLSAALGELKIDETGVAPYIHQQKKSLAEAPALEEYEISLPTVSSGSGTTVRIPPELMPPEEQAMEYFEIFFDHIHPYVPVVSKSYFYAQWHTNRRSISPLLLEAIFAAAGRMMPDDHDPAQGAQWLALASKHEDCFMDVPRLSTIQALLILLKARESAPKRGYYYRSWMTIKTLVAMGKDLELHEHLLDHQEGRGCNSDPSECMVKTRIWQNIYMCEMMIAGPQGRFDLGVDTDTVDLRVHDSPPGVDDSDYKISRNFTYLARIVRNVRTLNDTYAKIRKQKDWGSNPALLNLNAMFSKWLEEIPSDMQIHFPPDGSPPWLPNTFVGNMHCYHHLSIIMLHRPQLMKSPSFAAGGQWKQHMALCHDSAKKLCRIQEALLQTYDIEGLICMQRGINFAIYCVLSCTMLHLVAITSPDPDINSEAKNYFTRHMRILESCTVAWPMPDMQAQIQSLREAFSRDVNKPFELKPSFPFGSPMTRHQPTPPVESAYADPNLRSQTSHEPAPHTRYHSTPITPPISTSNSKDGSLDATSFPSLSQSQRQQPHIQTTLSSSHMSDDNLTWNPTRIFDQWNTAFGTPSQTSSVTNQQSPTLSSLYTPTASSIGTLDLPTLHDNMQQQQQQYTLPPNMAPAPPMHQQPPISMPYAVPNHPFVSPTMWQDTVASAYDPNGLKRRWDMGVSSYMSDQQQQVKRPR